MTILDYKPDAAAGIDAFINSNSPTTNYGTNTNIGMGEAYGYSWGVYRSLIKFTCLSDGTIPSGAIIDSGSIFLRKYGDFSNNARTLRAYRVKRAWTEAGVTWNKYDGVNDWQTAGATGANDIEATDVGNVSVPATGDGDWIEIPLTASAVQEIVAGTWTNNGYLLKVDTETDDYWGYGASDWADDTYRPRIYVVYHVDDVRRSFII
jgi:hypothetical protein